MAERTIGALAREHGLSRSTLLYYDRLGLLHPSGRSGGGNYRLYSAADAARLERICLYRSLGVPLQEIGRILDGGGTATAAGALERRLETLAAQIVELKRQQRSILQLLGQVELEEGTEMLNKDRWVAVMRASGMTEQDMHNWHVQFERMEPEAHQEFLELLGIGSDEITKIREWSRAAG